MRPHAAVVLVRSTPFACSRACMPTRRHTRRHILKLFFEGICVDMGAQRVPHFLSAQCVLTFMVIVIPTVDGKKPASECCHSPVSPQCQCCFCRALHAAGDPPHSRKLAGDPPHSRKLVRKPRQSFLPTLKWGAGGTFPSRLQSEHSSTN